MAALFDNQEALEMQLQNEGKEAEHYFERRSTSSHKPTKKTTTVEGQYKSKTTGRGRGRGRGRTGRPTVSVGSQESLDIMIAKLARARAIDRGEVVDEEEKKYTYTRTSSQWTYTGKQFNTKTGAPNKKYGGLPKPTHNHTENV